MRQSTVNSKQRTAECLLVAMLFVGAAGAQNIVGLPAAPASKGHVSYLEDGVEVPAGKPSTVELRFRVDQGFHVNSHTPASDLLIPTTLKLDDVAGVKVSSGEYPKGTAFRLPSGEMLDVYQGEFLVRLRMTVPKGNSTLTGGLRYQACDNSACFPPRTLAIKVAVTGK